MPCTLMLARVGGDRELLAEVIGFFLQDGPPLIETMRQALADGDYPSVQRAAHTLTGSSGNFDATAVMTLSRSLEAHAVAENGPAAQQAFSQLESETGKLLADLTTLMATL